MEIAPPANHVRSAPGLSRAQQTKSYSNCTGYPGLQRKQGERLFPEYFTRYSETTLAESCERIFCMNHELEEARLIRSWLQLYGGGDLQHWHKFVSYQQQTQWMFYQGSCYSMKSLKSPGI